MTLDIMFGPKLSITCNNPFKIHNLFLCKYLPSLQKEVWMFVTQVNELSKEANDTLGVR